MRPPCAPAHLLRSKTGRPSRNRTCDLPCIRRMHSLPCSRSVETRTRVELASPLYRNGASPAMLAGLKLGASGANRTLIGRLPCDCSATELHRLGPKGRFEPPSELYEGSVFPTKLLRHFSSNSLERVTGFEPVSGSWQGPILAVRRYPRGASGENRTLIGWVQTSSPPVERRPHGCGGGNRTRPNGGL